LNVSYRYRISLKS